MRKRQDKVGVFWFRAKIVPFLAILIMLLVATAALATRVPAMASSGSYNNADIATDALTHVKQTYGQCWPFVRDMIYQASNHTQDITAAAGGNDYFLHLQNAGGTRITDINALSKGDVVQQGEYGGHTFIIVSKVSVSGSTATYNIVDSNHAYNNVVMNYNRTFSLDNNERAYRFGTVNVSSGGGSGSIPGDCNGDGHVNAIDLSILLSHYGQAYAPCDFNHDGIVNVIDLSILQSHYGT